MVIRADIGDCGPSICKEGFAGVRRTVPSNIRSKSQFLVECLAIVSAPETQSASPSCPTVILLLYRLSKTARD
jgi:hypothetical protein